jgi:hypothetical protein
LEKREPAKAGAQRLSQRRVAGSAPSDALKNQRRGRTRAVQPFLSTA